MCYRKNQLFDTLIRQDPEQKTILSCMRGGWKNLVNLNFQIAMVTDSFDDLKIIHENEMIIIIEITDREHPENKLVCIYPYLTLLPLIPILN